MNTTGRALGAGCAPSSPYARSRSGGQADVEDVDQLVDRAGRARAAEDHRVVVAGAHAVADDLARVLAVARRLPAGARRLGVRVAVERHHLAADEVLDEAEAAPRRRVVGVRDAQRAVRRLDRLVGADDRRADGTRAAAACSASRRLDLVAERQRRQRHRLDRQAALVRQRAARRAQEVVERAIAEAARGPASLERRRAGCRSSGAATAARTAAPRAAARPASPPQRSNASRVERVDPRIAGRDAGRVARAAEQQPAGADQRAGQQAWPAAGRAPPAPGGTPPAARRPAGSSRSPASPSTSSASPSATRSGTIAAWMRREGVLGRPVQHRQQAQRRARATRAPRRRRRDARASRARARAAGSAGGGTSPGRGRQARQRRLDPPRRHQQRAVRAAASYASLPALPSWRSAASPRLRQHEQPRWARRAHRGGPLLADDERRRLADQLARPDLRDALAGDDDLQPALLDQRQLVGGIDSRTRAPRPRRARARASAPIDCANRSPASPSNAPETMSSAIPPTTDELTNQPVDDRALLAPVFLFVARRYGPTSRMSAPAATVWRSSRPRLRSSK